MKANEDDDDDEEQIFQQFKVCAYQLSRYFATYMCLRLFYWGMVLLGKRLSQTASPMISLPRCTSKLLELIFFPDACS